METAMLIRVACGALAIVIFGVIVWRRRRQTSD
jgi:hypothetical protein